MRRYLIPLAVLILAGFATKADAAITFAFSTDESVAPTTGDSLNLDVNVGDVTRIAVFLLEESGDARITDFGFRTAQFLANFNPGLGTVSNATNNAGFIFAPAPVVDNVAGTMIVGGGINQFAPDPPGLGVGNALVGFFDFEATDFGSTTFTFNDPRADSGVFEDVVLEDAPTFTSLDSEVFANAPMVTISAIPEPGSLAFLTFVGAIGAVRRRRRA